MRQHYGATRAFLRVRNRNRWVCLGLAVIIVPLGLATRAIPWLPDLIRNHAGDALWAAMVYWGWAFLFPQRPVGVIASIAFAFAFCIEVTQLWQHPLLVQARETRIGALVLGHGFLWIDLVRYFAGVAAAALTDLALLRWQRKFEAAM